MKMENASGALAEEDTMIATPLVGIAMNIAFSDSFTLRSQVVGMALSAGEGNGEGFDAEAAIIWTFYEGLYLTAGYKLFRADVEFDTEIMDATNGGDFDIEGPFFGLGLVF